ncbi:MAG: phosphodiester glycosidase family protein [Anaerolineae bacterium]
MIARWALLLITLTLTACSAAPLEPDITPSPTPDPWKHPLEGIDRLTLPLPTREGGEIIVQVVRLDPARFDLGVQYDPEQPRTIAGWGERTRAALVVNAGFFEPDYRSTALIVVDGVLYGESFDRSDVARWRRLGGMFSVVNGEPDVRWLAQEPYRPGEPLDQAVQGFPMLIAPGGMPLDLDLPDRAARRTVIAQDAQGRLLLMVIDGPASLYEVRGWLAGNPVLAVDAALNLDGGKSSGLVLALPHDTLTIDSEARVPGVITAYPRAEGQSGGE